MVKAAGEEPTRRLVYELYLGGTNPRFETFFEGPWSARDVTLMGRHAAKGLRKYKRELWEQSEKERRENLASEKEAEKEAKASDD